MLPNGDGQFFDHGSVIALDNIVAVYFNYGHLSIIPIADIADNRLNNLIRINIIILNLKLTPTIYQFALYSNPIYHYSQFI